MSGDEIDKAALRTHIESALILQPRIDTVDLAAETEATTKETEAGAHDPALERRLLVSEITNKVLVLIETGTPRRRAGRFAKFRAGLLNAVRVLLTPFNPEPRITEIEARYMGARVGSEEHRAYWWGLSGERMQEEIRALYRRRLRRQAVKKFLFRKLSSPFS